MADSEYPYPPDEFDREAATATLHGAHRAELPFWRQNLVYLIIIAAAFVLLLVLLFAIGGMGRDSGEDRTEAPTTAAEQTTAAASDAPAETSAEATPAAEPDRSTPVMVVNAGGISGMAGAWQETLEGSGWSEVDISTADTLQQEPVVFYRDEADAATAQALAQEVGAGEARQSDEYDAPITFIAVTEPGADQGGEDGGEGE